MGRTKKSKKHRTIKEIREKLKEPPKIRTGVQPTKIVPDKTKYSRKKRHQTFFSSEEE